MVCQFLLYNKVNQLYIYICIYLYMYVAITYISPCLLPLVSPSHPPLSHPSRWSQSTELISLCYVAASHQLSILHLVVYICPCHSLTSAHLTLPPPGVKSILYVCVFIPDLSLGFFRTIFFFLDSIYMCQHMVFVFLFLNYFTLYDSLQIHPPHYK